ncbi:MAG TPA: helix-turn-helix domain-containing protein [Actinomycetota bacterium]|nr:helix-turn-helix domain-containing protein [Actinomycetota bacterium]
MTLHIETEHEKERARALRAAVVARVESRADELADAMLVAYQQEIGAYGFLDDPAALAEVRAGTRMNLGVVLRAVANGSQLTDAELSALKEIGHRRAAQGFPLHGLLRAYQVGTRLAWQRILDALEAEDTDGSAAARLIAEVSVAVMGIMAQISSAATEAYLETERATAASEERLRRDLFNELLAGPLAASRPLRERAERVGYRLGDVNVVVVAAPEGGTADDGGLRSLAAALRTVRLMSLEPVVDARHGVAIAIVPVPTGISELRIKEAVEKALAGAFPRDVALCAAIGRPEGGASGVAASYRQALRTLDHARLIGRTDSVIGYLASIPSMLLREDVSAAMDLYRSTIEPLAKQDAEQGTQLVHTLAALLEERGNVLAAAKRLFVHRHTLSARIDRIEELTRRSLRSRDDLLLLELGLRARDVLPDASADQAPRDS